jgi:large exoprotein involved in heme utilization and adhesion
MTNTFIDASSQQAGGDGGAVTLRTNGSLSLTDSIIGTGAYETSAPGNGGAVTIMGKNVTFNNSGVGTDVTVSSNVTDTPALGQVHPGAVTVTAENTVTFSGSLFGDPGIPVINAKALGTQLDAGSVTVTGKIVNLSNGSIFTDMERGPIPSPGNGGAIEIRGNKVNLSQFTLQSINSGLIESTGRGGNILLRGADNLRADSIQLTASNVDAASVSGGGGGSIDFETRALTISDGSLVRTVSLGPGAGGTIAVREAENVTIQSGSQVLTDVLAGVPGLPQGSAGNILIETQNLSLLSGGQIGARTLVFSTGNAGDITVQRLASPTQSVLIDGLGSGIFSTTEGTGKGGNIFVNANSVTLQNGGHISSGSTGTGIAGDITINAGNQFTMANSLVTTEATQASGGSIKITTTPSGTVQLTNSTISASVLDGTGGGGSVDIDPLYVILLDSHIRANAVEGPGGNITINISNGGLFLPDATSTIDASSQFGVNGTVTIQSPNAPASGKIQPLGKTPLQATSLLNQRCAALAGGEFSSFTVAGRDSLPIEPGSWLASPLYAAGVGEGQGVRGKGQEDRTQGTSLAGETPLLSLRQIAPAGFLTQAFALDWSASCTS